MKLIVAFLVLIFSSPFFSCQKSGLTKNNSKGLTNSLVVPDGFTWENSRNVRFKISLLNEPAGKAFCSVTVYDHDPALGGLALSNGSASLLTAFETTVYLARDVSTVYIARSIPGSPRVITKLTIGSGEIIVSI